jgi:hypothetical protein
VIPLTRGKKKMTMSKMALLGVAVVAVLVIGSGTLAWVHNEPATANHDNAPNYVVGPDGRLIGAAPNASIRSQWERDGLPN